MRHLWNLEVERIKESIRSIRESINSTFGSFAEDIRIAMLPVEDQEEARYELLREQANNLADTLDTIDDPDELAATVAEIERLTREAWNVLGTDAQRQAVGDDFLAFLKEVKDIANARLDSIQTAMIDDLPTDPLMEAGDRLNAASGEILSASVNLSTSIPPFVSAVNAFRDAVRNINVNSNSIVDTSSVVNA